MNMNAWHFRSTGPIQLPFIGGEWRTFAHPYPESVAQTRAFTMPANSADWVAGQNSLKMRTRGTSPQLPMTLANVELEVVPE